MIIGSDWRVSLELVVPCGVVGTPFTKACFSLHTLLIFICCDLQACRRTRQLDEQRQWPSLSCLISHMHHAHEGFKVASWWSILKISCGRLHFGASLQGDLWSYHTISDGTCWLTEAHNLAPLTRLYEKQRANMPWTAKATSHQNGQLGPQLEVLPALLERASWSNCWHANLM